MDQEGHEESHISKCHLLMNQESGMTWMEKLVVIKCYQYPLSSAQGGYAQVKNMLATLMQR